MIDLKFNNINSNIFYLLPSILAFKKKYYFPSLVYFYEFMASISYHSVSKTEDKDEYLRRQNIDQFIALIVITINSFVIIERFHINPYQCIISAIFAITSFIFYFKYANIDNTSQENYDIYHPYWHLITGVGSAILYVY